MADDVSRPTLKYSASFNGERLPLLFGRGSDRDMQLPYNRVMTTAERLTQKV
jgi:hypothetical protein